MNYVQVTFSNVEFIFLRLDRLNEWGLGFNLGKKDLPAIVTLSEQIETSVPFEDW